MTCSTCHRVSRFVAVESQRIGRRLVEWVVCWRCWLREQREHGERVTAAIEQAERAGV